MRPPLRPTLNHGHVMLLRHRAVNARQATGKAAVECAELLQGMLGPDEVLALTAAWLELEEAKRRAQIIPPRGKRRLAREQRQLRG